MTAIPIVLMVAWLFIIGGKRLRMILAASRQIKSKQNALKYLLFIEPFSELLERSRLYEYMALSLSSYHAKLVILRGIRWQLQQTKELLGGAAGYGYAAMIGCAWLACAAGEPLLLAMGALLGLLLPVRQLLEAGKLIKQRKQEIILELPEMISKLMLLVGAGETALQALGRCLEGKDTAQHPLYKEWNKVVYSLHNGESFSTAAEKFNRSCAVQEVSIFTTVLLLNYRRGGEHFVLALRELSYTLWEKRKAVARARGEEASSKLVFPLVGILLVLMVFIAAPAMLLMS
ncbi:hypothetical protein BBD42_16810 [Paenibacillus sp. BIHB 4019]|uniref:Type II secretion system protein GspF domain-containing protein n=1 Tax=Paenibacillus sp. BIHB 4019 TaxID=1870819 RepID=A0A1B2DJR6_9BACL|nr:type II secretion system F family protein [Paenibacillus sp. BIHB 4019]ANY67948.1 hypothetical protein BBD42_16810 [Paenibacillus sp. BIHB 4019]